MLKSMLLYVLKIEKKIKENFQISRLLHITVLVWFVPLKKIKMLYIYID